MACLSVLLNSILTREGVRHFYVLIARDRRLLAITVSLFALEISGNSCEAISYQPYTWENEILAAV